jgi:hypothetical protein
MTASDGSEAMVGRLMRSHAAESAATITASTPQSFTPCRLEQSSGFFNIDAMVTAVDAKRPQWAGGPSPALILPIVHRSRRPESRVLRSDATTAPTAHESSRKAHASKHSTRRSDTLALVGFGLAWIATTGAGSILVGKWISPAHPVTYAEVVGGHCPAASTPLPPPCPASLAEPPLVAVQDLPAAPPRATPRVVRDAAAHPPVAPSTGAVAAAAAPHAFHGDRRADAASWGARSQRAAKTPPQPRSLEDWIRSAVGN